MSYTTLTIAKDPEGAKDSKGAPVKTRSFSVTLLGAVTANHLWEEASEGSAPRPIWVAYAGSEEQVRAFTANVRGGRLAEMPGDRPGIELPKNAPHRFFTQKLDGDVRGAIACGYIPALFHLDLPTPGAKDIRFILMPPKGWVERQTHLLEEDFKADARDVSKAALFAAFLDRRTSLPIIQDLRFHHAIYRAALKEDLATEPRWAGDLEALGLELPVACWTSHEDLERFLIAQTHAFIKKEKSHGADRFHPGRRILPYPRTALAQLRLPAAA